MSCGNKTMGALVRTLRDLGIVAARPGEAVLAWALVAGIAWSGPPLVTDDSETPGRGGWEVNISHNIEMNREEFLMESPLIDINYGLLENDQWKIEFPVLSVDPADEERHWGVGDLLIGWKYRFLEEDQAGFMASVYPQPLIPTGNEGVGLSDGNFELLLPVQVGKHFCEEKLFVYAEAGYNIVFDPDGVDEWNFGVAGEWQRTDRLVLVGEVGGVVFQRGDEADYAFFNGGLKYDLRDGVTFITSAGRSLQGRGSGAPELLTFVGFQFTRGGVQRAEQEQENDAE